MKKQSGVISINKTSGNEINRLLKLIPEDRRVIAKSLIFEIGFMSRTLDRLRAEIEASEVVDHYKNGKQEFTRESPALKTYNNMIPKYSGLYKQLVALLPATVQDAASDALQDFLKG